MRSVEGMLTKGWWEFMGAVLNKKLINKVGSDNGSLEEAIYTEMTKTFQIIKNYSNLLFCHYQVEQF